MTNSLLIQALGTLISIALFAACVTTYSRVILRLRQEGGNVRSAGFQISEALAAFVLASFFIGLLAKTLSQRQVADVPLTVQQVAPSSIIFIVISGGIACFLKFFRGMKLRETFGLCRLSPLKILGWAAGLMVCAFPLIFFAGYLSLLALPKEDVTPQPLVQLFRDVAHHGNYRAVIAILIDGVIVAPMCEEFLFRGFFYGVGKRFLGAIPAGLLTALLFAAFHLNLASFASLFVLALCFTLAYERTGSLLVPMSMHALFNLVNLGVIFAQAQGWFPTQ